MDLLSLLSLVLLLASTLYFFSHKLKRSELPLPPGPRGWPLVGNLFQLGPKPHHTLSTLSQSYGPLFHLRLGCSHVVVASSAAIAATILRAHDSNFLDRPAVAGATYMSYGCRSISFIPYGPRWRLLRRLAAIHLLSPKALDEFRSVRRDEVATLVSALAAAPAEGVEVGRWLNACVSNAMTRALLGRRMFGAVSEEAGEFKEMVVEITRLGGAFVVGDFIPALKWLDLGGVVAQIKTLATRFDKFLDGVIDDHLKAGGSERGGDMLSVLIGLKENADGEGEKLSDEDIKASLVDMFVAGTDTSSSTVEWALAELIRHPEVLQRAQQELDSIVGPSRLVSETDLANLPYMQAIIKETFRLHPPTPLSLPRIAADRCFINGYHIPKGTTLFINVWAIARDPSTWTEPLQFQPERFLPGGDHANVDVRGNDFELIPFGAGRRICAGMQLGLLTVQFMTATLVHAFDWALPMGQDPENLNMEEAYGVTIQRTVPLIACPRPRLAPYLYTATSS